MDLPLERLELSIIGREIKGRRLIRAPYLEVGCGDGFNLEEFSSLGMRGVGVDVSKEALDITRAKHLPNVVLEHKDFLFYNPNNLPEVIFMLNTLEHVGDDMVFLKKAHALLSVGGYLVIAVPST